MSYQCLGCGNYNSKKLPQGTCPAGGSYHVKSHHAKADFSAQNTKKQ